MIDLYEGLPRPVPSEGLIGWNSPPTIVGDIVVIGAAFDYLRPWYETPLPGAVRGYDVRTGKRLWTFHTIPPRGEFGADTWAEGSLEYASNVGMWAPAVADLELGYVYLPLEAAAGGLYGGHRHGNNLFANSLVCIDAKTGRRIWHFQLVHHDVWDYDIPAHPILADITVNVARLKQSRRLRSKGSSMFSTGRPCRPQTCGYGQSGRVPLHRTVDAARGDDLVRRLAALHPPLERRHHVERVRAFTPRQCPMPGAMNRR